MAYQNNIPQSTDDPSASQAEFLANFEEIATLIAVNHEAFNLGDQGKHKFLQLPEQSSAPATAANEGGLYTKAVAGATQLFFREESSGDELQLTGAFTAAGTGEVTLPGGLGMKWGSSTATTAGATITYTGIGLTAFSTATYNVTLGSRSNNFNAIQVNGTPTATAFVLKSQAASPTVYWVAIGM